MQESRHPHTPAGEETAQIVTFRVGNEEYGLDINTITEAIRPLPITPLPHMPPFVEGVINLRGKLIPVVDLRKRFSVPDLRGNPRTIRMLITRGALQSARRGRRQLIGLVVDGVGEVLHVPRRQIEAAPEAATGSLTAFIAGVAKVADRLVVILDIAGILTGDERAALSEASDAQP